MQAFQSQACISAKLEAFFDSVHNKNHSRPVQVEALPFWNSLFSEFVPRVQSSQSKVNQESNQLSKLNEGYFVNIVKYLSVYFSNSQKQFKIQCAKSHKTKVVNGTYFLDLFMQRVNDQFVISGLQNTNTTMPIRQVTQYCIDNIEGRYQQAMTDGDCSGQAVGQGNKQSIQDKVQGMKLMLNTMLSIPEMWLNAKMSKRNNLKQGNLANQLSVQESQKSGVPSQYLQYKFMISTLIIRYLSEELSNEELSTNTTSKRLFNSQNYINGVLLHVMNKMLMQTSFLSELQKIEGMNKDRESGSVWKEVLFGELMEKGSNNGQGSENEGIEEKRREKVREFVIKNYECLVKKQKLTEMIFYMWASIKAQTSNRQTSIDSNIDGIRNFLVQLFAQNYGKKKQLYYICESSSQLGQTYLKPSMYSEFYSLLKDIDSRRQQSLSGKQSCIDYCFMQLGYWWSLNKDYLLGNNACHFRYNLIACMLEKSQAEYLQSHEKGSLIGWVSEGIQARLIDARYHSSAILIWSKLAQTLNFQLDRNLFANVSYFLNPLPDKSISTKQQPSSTKQQPSSTKQSIQTQQKQTLQGSLELPLEQTQQQQPLSHSSPITSINSQHTHLQDDSTLYEVKLKPPQTLQDCILALQNPLRRQLGFKQLQKLLITQSSDVIFVWKSLLKILLHPLEPKSQQPLKTLFVLRPKEWIQDVGELYFKKDMGLDEKILFIETLELGVSELGENPHKIVPNSDQNQSQDFYFKRVASKYFTQKPLISLPNDESRTRRWGHTRIAHEKGKTQGEGSGRSSLSSSLLIVNSSPYINRLYEIVSELAFKIVFRMTEGIDKCVKTQPLYVQHLLNLLSTIAQNIKNHLHKYLVLQDIALVCSKVLTQIQKLSNGEKKETFTGIFTPKPQWDKKALSQIVMGCIQALNKVALALDKFVPELTMMNLGECVKRLKKIDMYSIRPLVEMVEANIYKQTAGSVNLGLVMVE